MGPEQAGRGSSMWWKEKLAGDTQAGSLKCRVAKQRGKGVWGLNIEARGCGESYCMKAFGQSDAYLSLPPLEALPWNPPMFSSRSAELQTVSEHRAHTSTPPLAPGLAGSDSSVWGGGGKRTRRQWARQYAWNIQLLQPKQKHLFYRGNIDLNCNLIGS